MRANSGRLKRSCRSPASASRGAHASSTAWTAASFWLPDRTANRAWARARWRPASSRATIVLAKLGGAGAVVITASSASRSAIAVAKAVGNPAAVTRSHGGTPP